MIRGRSSAETLSGVVTGGTGFCGGVGTGFFGAMIFTSIIDVTVILQPNVNQSKD